MIYLDPFQFKMFHVSRRSWVNTELFEFLNLRGITLPNIFYLTKIQTWPVYRPSIPWCNYMYILNGDNERKLWIVLNFPSLNRHKITVKNPDKNSHVVSTCIWMGNEWWQNEKRMVNGNTIYMPHPFHGRNIKTFWLSSKLDRSAKFSIWPYIIEISKCDNNIQLLTRSEDNSCFVWPKDISIARSCSVQGSYKTAVVWGHSM